ncbi:MAG TPA: hypothetical protein PL152_09860, partial [Steroidobacteraceae bacterium]|nr:hypothetical protein [Steroidobacteraceae bacterium]
SLLHRLRERGVLRVAASYAVIAWLLLQVASVVLDPLGIPKWVMTALIIAAAVGFPVAVGLAWFLEIGEHGIEVDRAAEGVPRPTARGLRHYADVIVIGVLVIAVVVLLVRQSDIGKPKPPSNPAIAVLPFENLSGDPAQEYFSDGLAEETLDRLGRVPGLKVIARSSSFTFKGSKLDAKAIAEKLGVTTILEGSVRRDGRRLKLSARLIDGATGQQAWSGSFDREMTDVFDVQAELAAAIVNAIVPAARGETVTTSAPPTTDLNAYDLYLLARAQLVLRTPEGIQKSLDLSRQAVALDPSFARAHAHLATSILFYTMFFDPPQVERAANLRAAESAVHRALAIDPDLSEAHQAYAMLLRDTGQPGAEEEYRKALDLNPNNAAAWHDYAVFLGNFPKREAESARATARSLELDPRQPSTWANYLGYVQRKEPARLPAELERAIRTVGDMPGALMRFPLVDWSSDREGIRRQFAHWWPRLKDGPGGADGIMLPDGALRGFPVEVLRSGLAKENAPPVLGNMAPWLNRYRAWLTVDPVRALEALPGPGDRPRSGEHDAGLAEAPTIQKYLEIDALGRTGNWKDLDRALAQLVGIRGADDRDALRIAAFWYAVQGRYEEAAGSLDKSLPFPAQMFVPPVLGGDARQGMIEAAQVRILRGTGKSAEADRLARNLLDDLRRKRTSARTRCWAPDEDDTMRLAALAAGEGLKDEAVAALSDAMRCGDLPFGFEPELPWFKALEGYPPYDELVRERTRRLAQARADMLALEAGAKRQAAILQ